MKSLGKKQAGGVLKKIGTAILKKRPAKQVFGAAGTIAGGTAGTAGVLLYKSKKDLVESEAKKKQKEVKKPKMAQGGSTSKSKVNEAGNYTNPGMRKSLFNKIKAGTKGGNAGQWSARKAQMLAREYKSKGGGYK